MLLPKLPPARRISPAAKHSVRFPGATRRIAGLKSRLAWRGARLVLVAAIFWITPPPTAPAPAGAVAAEPAPAGGEDRAEYETLTIRGRVVWMAEALDRLFGIRSVPEAKERLLAIETPGGQLHPIVADIRGRSFRRDPRLRVDGEFLVRRYQGSPMVQVIRIYEVTDEGKFELDYWCEICAIAMFELKACDCCQGPIELRRRPAAEADESRQPAGGDR